jgi:hypothetical protein
MKKSFSHFRRLHSFRAILTTTSACLICCNSGISHDAYEIKQGPYIVKVALNRLSDSASYLSAIRYEKSTLVDSSRWELPYPVYHFETGDIDGDGIDDIAVGVTKATRNDSIVRKRIFLFQLQEGNIIPLWLGSCVSQPLNDFALFRTSGHSNIRTIEQERNGSCLVAEYEWYGFGLSFVRYIAQNSSLRQAKQLLRKTL